MQEGQTSVTRSNFFQANILKRFLGICICVGGSFLILREVASLPFFEHDRMTGALIGGGVAALATALGTLPVLLSQKFSQRTHDGFLGFSAGIMLAATSFSLLVPAITSSRLQYGNPVVSSVVVGCAMLVGAIFIAIMDRLITIDVVKSFHIGTKKSIRHAWLFVLAVTLHNLPEGLAIGVAYGGIDIEKANSLATAVAIQDVPEGLVVALALRTIGHTRIFSVMLGMASGLIEPIAAVAGVAMIDSFASLLPFGLAAAAGAMLFVLCRDVIPTAHAHGYNNVATCALLLGFVIMTVLDTVLT